MSQVFLQTLDQRWNRYAAELKNCRAAFSEEGVHDLRVATRRLLAVIDMARLLDPHPRLQKLRRIFKGQIDELDDLRDTQVMLAEISERILDLPSLRPVQVQLQSDEKKLLRRARKQIKSFELPSVRKRVRRLRAVLEAQTGLDAGILQAVDLAYSTVKQRYLLVDAAEAATIHRLRLSFKKFRYMVEIAYLALPDFPGEQLKRMHDYQAAMGEIQDLQLFLDTLTDFAEQNAAGGAELSLARRHYERTRADAIAAFLEAKSEFLTFWRPADDSPFPWSGPGRAAQPAAETDDPPPN